MPVSEVLIAIAGECVQHGFGPSAGAVGEFKNSAAADWTQLRTSQIAALLRGAIQLTLRIDDQPHMSHIPKDKLRVFYSSIDLVAWRKLRGETYQMPDPIALCNTFCSEFVLTWYGFIYPARSTLIDPQTDSVRYFFDRNEYFFQPFYDKWSRERNQSAATGRWSIWNAIDEVASVEMKKTPGVQGGGHSRMGTEPGDFRERRRHSQPPGSHPSPSHANLLRDLERSETERAI